VTSGTGNVLAALGLTAGTTNVTLPALSGETLTIGATGGGVGTNITFDTGARQVSTLNELNAALAANNLQASIDTTGKIRHRHHKRCGIVENRRYWRHGCHRRWALHSLTGPRPVADPNSQATRANLVNQYNNVLTQINTTAQAASFNGINLLNGDMLKLVFNETGRSTLSIQGVTFNDAGLGLSNLTVGVRFLDGNSANKVLAQLDSASTTLRAEASALGSNSIVQIRQDFNKNLINMLQTRRIQPDAGRRQRGSGQQPGAGDTAVDYGLRAGAGESVAGQRAAAATLISAASGTKRWDDPAVCPPEVGYTRPCKALGIFPVLSRRYCLSNGLAI
jgi:flagellin